MLDKLKKLIMPIIFSSIGYILIVNYILNASVDVPTSDYIRIINYYLSDVHDLSLLLSWEGISRIPITFLMRIINVDFFHYSVLFDKIIGVLGLFLFNFVVLYYISKNIKNNILSFLGFLLVTIITFSLIGWEMILNGTGYPHFFSIGLYALIYYLYTYSFNKNDGINFKNILFMSLVAIVAIIFSGAYAVAPLCSIMFLAIVNMLFKNTKNKLNFVTLFFLSGIANFLLVFLARYKFMNIDYGMSSRYSIQYMSLTIAVVLTFLLYIDKLLNKNVTNLNVGFSNYNTNSNDKKFEIKYILLIIVSIVSLLLYFKSNNTGEALVPIGIKDISLMTLVTTDILFIFKFLFKSLASSIIGVETFDYAITMGTATEKVVYGVGIIYFIVILYSIYIFILLFLDLSNIKKINTENTKTTISDIFNTVKVLICSFILVAIFGCHMLTNYTELEKMPVRKYIYQTVRNIALYLENTPDEELPSIFEYRRGVDQIKNAIQILKDRNLSIFYQQSVIDNNK